MENEIPKETETIYPLFIKCGDDIYKIFDENKCLAINTVKYNIYVHKERPTLISLLMQVVANPTKETFLITEECFITTYSKALVELNSLAISQEINCKF